MKKISALAFSLSISALCATGTRAEVPGLTEPVVVVDKKLNQIHLANYNDGRLDFLRTFRVTFGKSNGDKLMEGDLKTPEGIYEFLYRKVPHDKKFGPLAVYISYPNATDKNGAKTGNQILLHGTDDPSRLERPFDSLGCVVTDNDNVKFISDHIKIKDTKIIITKDASWHKDSPRLPRAKAFFQGWLDAWSNKDTVTYVESYADEYRNEGRNRLAFLKYKESLNQMYDTIKVTATDVRYYFHEKYDLISFNQHYRSTKNGAVAYEKTSRKNLYIQERNGFYKILVEENRN